jgi:hypothetical protein
MAYLSIRVLMKFSTFLYNVAARAEENFHDEISKIAATSQ